MVSPMCRQLLRLWGPNNFDHLKAKSVWFISFTTRFPVSRGKVDRAGVVLRVSILKPNPNLILNPDPDPERWDNEPSPNL